MKKQKLTLLALAAGLGLAGSAYGQAFTLDFQGNTVTGGNLVLLESGSDPNNDFTGDRFDEQASADFEIQNIVGFGTLGITATALSDNLNVTSNGLQDGSTGYNGAGEGTSLIFDADVRIDFLDWVSFTSADSDSVGLSSGSTAIGTFNAGTVTGTTDFTSTNPATMAIVVAAGDAFRMSHAGGTFYLGQMGITVVPEPGSFALIAGCLGMVSIMLKRRRT
jgi:hypothetical protein